MNAVENDHVGTVYDRGISSPREPKVHFEAGPGLRCAPSAAVITRPSDFVSWIRSGCSSLLFGWNIAVRANSGFVGLQLATAAAHHIAGRQRGLCLVRELLPALVVNTGSLGHRNGEVLAVAIRVRSLPGPDLDIRHPHELADEVSIGLIDAEIPSLSLLQLHAPIGTLAEADHVRGLVWDIDRSGPFGLVGRSVLAARRQGREQRG